MAISFVGYDEKTQTLTVSFGDSVYSYSGVPESVANGLKYADANNVSTGMYFQKYVKSYKARKVR